MLLDTAFCLAHNTAPIFNKGKLFHHQDVSSLYTILDVQASGQIPFLFNEEPNYPGAPYVEHSRKLFDGIRGVFGDEKDRAVDWGEVAENGKGHMNYDALIGSSQQITVFGKGKTTSKQKKKKVPNHKYFTIVGNEKFETIDRKSESAGDGKIKITLSTGQVVDLDFAFAEKAQP